MISIYFGSHMKKGWLNPVFENFVNKEILAA
jgi:hypothetical protein